jgi:lipoprotein-anchoring transpeptidase ErfK/SrfK
VLEVTQVAMNKHCVPTWYKVELSVLPNGTTAWVPAQAVRIHRVVSRIVIDLSRRSLRVYRSGRLLLQTMVGIGAASTPTPTGTYFVNERYALSSAGGPFGPAALGISAHSVALQHSWVENGPIAIHGTNEPWSIGQAASHGCIHIANDVMRKVFSLAPDGTPVIVAP